MTTEFIRGLYNIKPHHQGVVLTIGNFDGLHIGHQALIAQVKQKAALLQAPSMVMTFEPLPKEVFAKQADIPRLMKWRERYEFLSAMKVDFLFVAKFNKALANMTPQEFVEKVLWKKLKVKHVIVGDDFRFGYKRQGDFACLVALGKQRGFSVGSIPSVKVENERVSSSLVRQALLQGNHQRTEKLLGRPYTMSGRIVHGNKLGRILGFPTANIELHRAVTPVQGIYIVKMHGIDSAKGLPGVANVGIRPTIGGTRALLEVYLFDFNQDIYGRYVTVEFCQKLRNEERYDNLELLKNQIVIDANQARHYFIERGELKNE